MSSFSSLSQTENDYLAHLRFLSEHSEMTYEQFDKYLLNGISLFDVPKDESFRLIEESLDKILAALPACKRIFSKPIVHLKDTQTIVPVEAVRIINNDTLSHAALHSELWADIGKDGMKPKKLMTVEKTENYAIYENIVFSRAVDSILKYVRRNLILLKDILYGCRELHFNLLDRTHHRSYFLAIGKLHAEYARSQERYNQAYARCIEKLLFIEKTLQARLRSPVYVHCKKSKQKLTLKKTNTFRSHKDYKEVYHLLKSLNIDLDAITTAPSDEGASHDEYRAFCLLLSVFAAGHFNFTFAEGKPLNFAALKAKATFLGWTLTIKTVKNRRVDGICFTLKKDVEYTVCLLLCERSEMTARGFEAFKRSAKADEYLFATPYSYGGEDTVYLSLFDIDSFRRLQQLILRGMIYSDTTQESCAFCGSRTERTKTGYECPICRAKVTSAVCEATGLPYYISEINRYRSLWQDSHRTEPGKFLHDRYAEAQLHFRNITPLASDGTPRCPRCGRVH